MLLFYCARDDERARIAREGIAGPVTLHTALDAAQATCGARILVVDAFALTRHGESLPSPAGIESNFVPPGGLRHADPYLAPRPVTAAGGFVVRRTEAEPEILMIYRRGAWDIPKGKLDAGETIEACALREVREEVGIHDLALIQPLGATVHGYPRGGKYHVKTTHWFEMQTGQTAFTPQAEEDIEAVAWMPWGEAVEKVGFVSFRRHLQRVRPIVRG